MNEYITAKEYTELTGISFDEFYTKYFSGYFQGYSKDENGIYILKSFVEEKEIQKEKKKEIPTETEKTADNTAELKAEIERLKQVIAEKDNQLIEFAFKFAELSQQALQITSQSQYIQVLDKAPESSAEDTEIQTEIETPKKKKGLLKRLLKK